MSIDLSKFDPKKVNLDKQLVDLDRADCEESLYEFLKHAWPFIDPAPWIDSWAIDAIAEHLQAVVDGQIRKLVINISPRTSKSSLVSVAFAPWVWAQPKDGPISGPKTPFLYASYSNQLSLRDSVKCRRLIESAWYQARWGRRFALTSDQNTKSRFTNDRGGERLITSIDGTTTGEGSQVLIGDDLNSAAEAASALSLQAVKDWFDTVASTRLNDPKTGAYIIIQQRLAEGDITGHILEKSVGEWCHLMIPMRYERDRSFMSPIGWSDPRTEEGQLMWPERFGEEEVQSLERALGPWGSAGQLQQRPEPKGGGIIRREWWKLWDRDTFPPMDFILACVDTAYTTDQMNDESGMIVWGIFSGNTQARTTRIVGPDGEAMRPSSTYSEFAPKLMCMWAWAGHFELHELVEKVAESCTKMKVDTLLIENKASGISVAQEIRRLYSRERFGVELFDPKSQDKMARLYSIQHIFAEGVVYAPDREWMEKVITQVGQFPKGRRDEFVDLTSMGLRKLRDMGLLVRQAERAAEVEESKIYRGKQEPLYSV